MPELLPIDQSVKVPSAVAETIARANALHGEIYPAADADDPQDGAAATAAATTADATSTTTQVAPVVPPAPVTHPGNESDWKSRYDAMKGRYDAELPRLRGQISALSKRNAELERHVAEIEAAATRVAASEDPAHRTRLLSDQEVSEYGEEFLSVVGKRAKEEVNRDMEYLKDEVKRLNMKVSGVSGHVEQNERDRLFSSLDSRVPDWRDVNTNADFIHWLSLQDPFSGAIRQTMLSEAFERNDAPRVAAFFTGFLAQEAAVGPATTEPDPGTKPNRIPLDRFAAPGRAKSAAASTAPAEKPFITRSDITAFYADVRRGLYQAKPDEKDRIERAISEATREGRVR